MRKLDRMVSVSFLKLFLVFVMLAPSLFILADLTERLGRYLDRGLTGFEIFQAYVFMYPQFMLFCFPIAALIAAVFTVQPLTVTREVMAAKAGGISFRRLFLPIAFWAAVLSGVGLLVSDSITHSTRRSSEILDQQDGRGLRRSSFVYQTENGAFLSVAQLSAVDNTMDGVTLDLPEREIDGQLVRPQIQAARGVWTDREGWVLQNGYYRLLGDDGAEQSYQFDAALVRELTERPVELVEIPREAEEMTYAQLVRQVEILTRAGGEPRKLMVEGEQRWSIPMATLVVALFGAPLATTAKRGGAAFGVGLSLATTIAYILIMRVSGALGEAGTLEPVMAAWLPNWIFAVVALGLIARVRT